MTKQNHLLEKIQQVFDDTILSCSSEFHEVTMECSVESLTTVLTQLRDREEFALDELIDLAGVDYLFYGQYDWETQSSTEFGFSRGVEKNTQKACAWDKPRFAVVYHLLSTRLNHRVRVKVFVDEHNMVVPSVHTIWKSANWFEREAYDLYGLLFEGHPDLRRILTDYGFIGYPFRKDFPLSGHVEMRYDASLKKVIYEPVDIVPRVTVPKVIREDNRYSPHMDKKGVVSS